MASSCISAYWRDRLHREPWHGLTRAARYSNSVLRLHEVAIPTARCRTAVPATAALTEQHAWSTPKSCHRRVDLWGWRSPATTTLCVITTRLIFDVAQPEAYSGSRRLGGRSTVIAPILSAQMSETEITTRGTGAKPATGRSTTASCAPSASIITPPPGGPPRRRRAFVRRALRRRSYRLF